MKKQRLDRMKKTACLFVIIFFSILVSTAAAETNCNTGNDSNSGQNTGTPDYIDAGSGNVFNDVTFNNVTFINSANSRNTFNNVTFNNVTFRNEQNPRIIVHNRQSSGNTVNDELNTEDTANNESSRSGHC